MFWILERLEVEQLLSRTLEVFFYPLEIKDNFFFRRLIPLYRKVHFVFTRGLWFFSQTPNLYLLVDRRELVLVHIYTFIS